MQSIQQYIPVTKAKSELLAIIRDIKDNNDTIAITKNGVPEAIMISIKKFDGLLETLDILSDDISMKSIKKSIKEAEKGIWLDMHEVFGQD